VILTDREIQIALDKKQITIDPLPALEAYSSTSVDLTLDQHINVFRDDLSDDPMLSILTIGTLSRSAHSPRLQKDCQLTKMDIYSLMVN